MFRWCGPGRFRDLESRFARRPESLERVEVWWGGRDAVVSPRELGWTRAALGVRWPERTFPAWGHYPMIDDPEGWARALAATAREGGTAIIGR